MSLFDPLRPSSFAGESSVAVIERDREISYSELAALAHASAEQFASLAPNGPVALVATPTTEALAALLGCFEARLPVLLLHPRDPTVRQEELLSRCACRSLFRDREWQPTAARSNAPSLAPADRVLIPTSGTSGEPKLTVLTEDGMRAALQASQAVIPLGPGRRWVLSLPFAHVGGLSIPLRCFGTGATVVLGDFDWGVASTWDDVERLHVTHLSFVPTQLRRAVQALERVPPSLERILVGGAAASPRLRQAARSLGLPVAFTYGMTEMMSQISTQIAPFEGPNENEVDVGVPLPGVEITLCDDGRIAVRGPQLARAHLFSPEPLTDDDGFFFTNDRGRWDEKGRLVVLGRSDQLIITGGENVAPEEVESALCDLPGIHEACVFGVPDDEWGERVVGLVTMTVPPEKASAARNWKGTLGETLPAFAFPKAVYVVPQLPRLPSGKIDRRAAKALFVGPSQKELISLGVGAPSDPVDP